MLRTGDGCHPYSKEAAKNLKKIDSNNNFNKEETEKENFWGYGKYCHYLYLQKNIYFHFFFFANR